MMVFGKLKVIFLKFPLNDTTSSSSFHDPAVIFHQIDESQQLSAIFEPGDETGGAVSSPGSSGLEQFWGQWKGVYVEDVRISLSLSLPLALKLKI